MSSPNEQLQTLRQMETDGRISYREYEDLARRLLTPDEIETPEPVASPSVETKDERTPLFPPVPRPGVNANHLGTIGIASFVLMVISALGLMPWHITLLAVPVMLTTLFDGWQQVTIGGAALVAVLLLFSLGGSTEAEATSGNVVPSAPTLPATPEPIAGSLGIYVDQVPDLWNTVNGPPRMTKGLTRYNEAGEYDSFLYRFGKWGRLAGAYDPADDAVYALLATGTIGKESTDRLYMHMCFVVAPYSQDCLDTYQRDGLGGAELDALIDVARTAAWTLGEHHWQLEIAGDLLTIRVFGADAG